MEGKKYIKLTSPREVSPQIAQYIKEGAGFNQNIAARKKV